MMRMWEKSVSWSPVAAVQALDTSGEIWDGLPACVRMTLGEMQSLVDEMQTWPDVPGVFPGNPRRKEAPHAR